MKSVKSKLIPIISLGAAAAVAVGTFFGLNFAKAERSVTVSGSTVFTTAANAEIWSHEVVKTPAEGEPAVNDYYTMFVLKSDNDTVNFRKNLAYQWYYDASEKPAEDAASVSPEKEEGLFNTTIGFEANEDNKLDFERFILTFESQQYSQTKDGKSVNYIIFAPADNGTDLNVLITDDKEAEFPANPQTVGADNIKIEFTQKNDGGTFAVRVATEGKSATGEFKNVGGTYARYSSSTTTPVTPISFSAEFPKEEDGEENEAVSYARMIMYSLNGQSFKLKETPSKVENHFRSGVISDDTPPVLCLDKGVTFIGHNKEISFNYTVIDVVTSSPSLETSYFMLTKDQASKTDFKADDYKQDKLFRIVKDSDDQKMDPHVGHYIPDPDKTPPEYDKSVFDKDMDVTAAVKVLLKLTDTTSTGGESTYVMLDWYVEDKYSVTVNGSKYIAVATDKEGAYYSHTQKTSPSTSADPAKGTSDLTGDWKKKVQDYQAEVDKAAADLKAGNKNHFYLPSAKSLFGDNATEYEDLIFNIYYISDSRQQESNKSYNALSIPLNKDGKYVFTVYATDAQSNKMYYFDKDGKKQEFGTGEIWTMYDDEDLKDYLPWFEFTVATTEISIEAPKEQSTAYVGSTFTPDSFEINGVSYNTNYSLYVFDSERYYAEHKQTLTYSEFMEKKDTLLSDSENGRKWFTYIYPSSGLQEGTDVYEKYNDYQWNNSSLSFVPQDENTYYLIKCEVTGKGNSGSQKAEAYMGIASAPKVAALEGEDTWVQDNMVSIILLCIAGASLVGIILLLVIKPKNKGDLDEIETSKPKKSKKQ